MIRFSPALRISSALVLISVSVLLIGNMVGLIPDKSIVVIETRKSLARSIATQCALAAQDFNVAGLKVTMDAIVETHPEIQSLGLRDTERDQYLAQTQNHSSHWVAPSGSISTPKHWQLPIQHGNEGWGTLEISFRPEGLDYILGYTINPIYLLIGFFGIVSFIIFLVYMKKVLRHLDPTQVMPSRVKKMLDTLTEGVIIMDNDEHIILANSYFEENIGLKDQSLMGLKINELDWLDHDTKKPYELRPWTDAMSQKQKQSNIRISLSTKLNNVRTFQANFSPILDNKNNCRGVLATFDDVTELENKNTQLKYMVNELQRSQEEVERQNVELEILATQDPMTNCLNRRAFFEKAEIQFEAAQNLEDNILACIMTDIDLFKSINDKYGHSVGDQVIIFFAEVLKKIVRGDDAICRYGGEEFCVLLQNCSPEDAIMIAERMRAWTYDRSATAVPEEPELRVSASFGVSTTKFGAKDVEELIDQADKSLYRAKKEGRNRVESWKNDFEEKEIQPQSQEAIDA